MDGFTRYETLGGMMLSKKNMVLCRVWCSDSDGRPATFRLLATEALEREHLVCRRCHRIRHYNEVGKTERTADDFRTVLQEVTDAGSSRGTHCGHL